MWAKIMLRLVLKDSKNKSLFIIWFKICIELYLILLDLWSLLFVIFIITNYVI